MNPYFKTVTSIKASEKSQSKMTKKLLSQYSSELKTKKKGVVYDRANFDS